MGQAEIESNNVTSRVFGTAVGANYPVSAYWLVGFALAGGGTTFGRGSDGLPTKGKRGQPSAGPEQVLARATRA
jgi:hypothetical protein